LVLHWGDGVLGGPVDSSWGCGGVEDSLFELWLVEGVVAGHGALELAGCHVSELIDSNGVSEGLGVVLVVVEDEIHVVLEGAELGLHFRFEVHFVVLGDERLEE